MQASYIYHSPMKSYYTWLLLSLFLVVGSLSYYPKFKQQHTEATISWDVSGYYWYLPAAFIYHDLKHLGFSDSNRNQYQCSPDNQQITILPDGKKVLKYSSGMALQYLPFFTIAHVMAGLLHYPQDGFSLPYQAAIHFGGLLIFILGLYFLRKVLLAYFEDTVVALVLFFLVIGTNYLNYAGIDIGMSHVWLFSWYAILLYVTKTYYDKPSVAKALGIGLICGLLALSRPTEIIAVVIPICWGITWNRASSFIERIRFIQSHLGHYAMAILTMIMVGSIQLCYWKYASGHWFVYSYGDQKFSWLHPHVFLYSIHFKSGWLIYTPLLWFALFGFFTLSKNRELFLCLGLFFLLNFWEVTAWDIWDYGGRAMIQGYAVLMFPLASFIQFVHQSRIIKWIFYPIAFFFTYLNVWWVHGAHKGGYIYPSDMTEAYYKKIVGRWHIQEQDRKLLDVSDDFKREPRHADTILRISFQQEKDSSDVQQVDGVYYLGLFAGRKTERRYPIPITQNNTWMRLRLSLICTKNNWDILRMCQVGLVFYKHAQVVKSNLILLDRLFYKEAQQVIDVDANLRHVDFDSAEVYINNPEAVQGSFYLKECSVLSFDQ